MTTDLTIIEQVQAQLVELPRVAALIRENLGGDDLTPQSLTRIRVPAGGGMSFEYPTPSGPEPRATFGGVILHRQAARVYWRDALDAGGGNAPPDCRADDAHTGVGDPGGDCKTCPLAQFGSKEGTNAQACKLLNLLYVMVPGNLLPVVVVAPPGSLRPVKDYMLGLTTAGMFYGHVTTIFGLEQAKSQAGIKYSRLKLTMDQPLDEPTRVVIDEARAQMAPLFGAVEVYQADAVAA